MHAYSAQRCDAALTRAAWQLDAGRDIPPPPDYEGMLASVRDEVAENFGAPKDAAKVKKTKTKKDADEEWDEDDEQPPEEGDEAPAEEE